MTPVVGFIDEWFRPRPSPSEVSAVFTVPLDFFMCDKDHFAAGGREPLHFFYFEEPDSGRRYEIWGLTALLAIVVASLALRKKAEFDVGLDSEDLLSFLQRRLHQRLSKL